LDFKKNILVITRWFPNVVEPVKCVFTKNIIDAQAKSEKYSYTVISPVPYFPDIKIPLFRKYAKFRNIPLVEKVDKYTIYSPGYVKLPYPFLVNFEWYSYFLKVLETIKEEDIRIDLIHAHGIYPDGLVAAKIGKYFKKRVVLHVHESYINKYSNNRLYLETFKNVDKIISVSHFQAQQIYNINPELIQKCTTIYNGVKLAKISTAPKKILNISRKITRLLFVGHLIDVKGLDLLLIALKNLKQYNLYLDIIGSGSSLREYRKNVKKYNLAERVKFLGEVSNKEVLQKMAEYDFLVLPSRYETFGIVLIEAMSRGVPVIATDVGAVSEIVTSEEVGVLVESENPKSLAEGIRKALTKSWDKENIIKHAEKFAIEKTVEKMEKVYDEILTI